MIRGAQPFVRILIRRPHAYFFLREHFVPEGGQTVGAVGGVSLDDGTLLPIPGVYLLDAAGQPLGRVGLSGENARGRLLKTLGAPADPSGSNGQSEQEESDG